MEKKKQRAWNVKVSFLESESQIWRLLELSQKEGKSVAISKKDRETFTKRCSP